uniref:Uncharacterized protein n=1 Tax=Arundo donax TaxID=35708 RepID=A0A0A9FSV8_ARUDO
MKDNLKSYSMPTTVSRHHSQTQLKFIWLQSKV